MRDWPGICFLKEARCPPPDEIFSQPFNASRISGSLRKLPSCFFPIAFFDYSTGYEVSLSILYCVPIFIVAWCTDRNSGVLMALLAALTWWWADIQAGHPYLLSWLEYWEVLVRCGFFIITAIGASAVKQQRDASASRIALLEYSQRLEREIIGTSERERERIGQDLHDGICQYLAALSCSAASLKGDLDGHHLAAEARVADELAGYSAGRRYPNPESGARACPRANGRIRPRVGAGRTDRVVDAPAWHSLRL